MKSILLLLLSTAVLLTAEAAPLARRPKAPGRRVFAHTTAVRDRSNHMRFRHNPPPLPILDLKAHDQEKFRTVHGPKRYKFK